MAYGHLVPLIGYCNEGTEVILIYEFMKNETLRDYVNHIYDSSEKSFSPSELSLMQRLFTSAAKA